MRFGSVCSGIEAASAAWQPLGWEAAFVSEIEPFPCAVLAHHHPQVPNFGDMTKFEEWPDADIDVLVGGTPCQSFSGAGLRGGLDDARGNLMLTYGAIARRYRPQWVVWENVPGVFSSDGGRDFASFLGLMSGQHIECPASGWQNSGVVPGIESAYGLAWRVLDAQYCGVPQRRRRVFVVGCLGDWRGAAAVLFERHGLQGHPAPRRETRERVAPTISARTKGGGGLGTDFDCDVGLIAGTLDAALGRSRGAGTPPGAICMSSGQGNAEISHDVGTTLTTLTTLHEAPVVAIQGAATRENPLSGPDGVGVRDDGIAYTLEARSEVQAVAFKASHFTRGKDGAPSEVVPPLSADADADADKGDQDTLLCFSAKDYGADVAADVAPTLRAGVMPAIGREERPPLTMIERVGALDTVKPWNVVSAMQVRRLTPRECERLQGFEDDYTLIPWRNKVAADGPRYKALGNSMAVPVMRWIGERIQQVSKLKTATSPSSPASVLPSS